MTLLGVIPTHKNVGLGEARRDLCMRDSPECPRQEAEIERWTLARNAIAVTGSTLLAGGLVLVAVGLWKRKTARGWQEELDRRTAPEWSISPSFGPSRTGASLTLRF